MDTCGRAAVVITLSSLLSLEIAVLVVEKVFVSWGKITTQVSVRHLGYFWSELRACSRFFLFVLTSPDLLILIRAGAVFINFAIRFSHSADGGSVTNSVVTLKS